ncbi:kinase-like domain-containing protein [Rhizophagus irregularis DAOM 181602=DAOM 197198]|nr:kinase-like domain-containing protein [Rhizophagus irregularis DAOM 181602=DAOM 197198]
MDQQTNYKLKTDFLISSDVPLNHQTQTSTLKSIYKKCNGCKRRRKVFNEIDQICVQCYKAKKIPLSGNKATWIDGPIVDWNEKKQKYNRYGEMTVALKELDSSENINSRKLNELKIYYNFVSKWKPDKEDAKEDRKSRKNYYVNISDYNNINICYGITQNPITKNFMIITKYYDMGDLAHYIANDFFNYIWYNKLSILHNIASGLKNIHDANIIHKDYHSGNIFVVYSYSATTGDLGLSKSAIESLDDENEIYGIIPYVAPEVLQGQKYTKASDIYSFGMIMWELMTGRRPFWDKNHDAELIIEICDGIRPPVVTNAPKGYVELMKECWHSDPNKRPTANDLSKIFVKDGKLDCGPEFENPTKIIKSPDIGPITNNPNAVYKSRPLSAMIKSAESTRSLKIQRYKPFNEGKRMINDNNSNEDTGNIDKTIKKIKLNKNDDYLSKELEFDIDNNINNSKFNNSDYTTKEIGFDI